MKTSIFIALLLFSSFALAEKFSLSCTGKMYMYESGFGVPNEEPSSNTNTIVRIDTSQKQASTSFLLGESTSHMTRFDDEWIAFNISREAQYKNAFVKDEAVSINRFTGEIIAIYATSLDDEKNSYMSFIGKCRKASKKF